MDKAKGKIGIRELLAIIILSIGTKISDDTPVILFTYMQSAAWMSPIIIGALSFIPIALLIKVMTAYDNKNLAEVVNHVFGKFIGFFILAILWLILFFALITDSAIYSDIISTMYFNNTPTLVIYALLMFVCAYGARKGLEEIGSVAWAVIFWVKISLVVAIIFTISQGQLAFIFPFFGSGKWELLKESSLRTSIFSDFLYLGLIFPYVKSKRDFKRGTWIALSIIIIEFTIALVAYVMLFDFLGVSLMNFPYHESIRYIKIGFLTNTETFFFPFWIVATFVRFTFYLYLTAFLFGSLFKIKRFEFIIPTIATLTVFIGMIPETPTFTIFNLRDKLLLLTTPVFIILPFLLWMVAKLKGDLKNEKTNTSK